jgi:hypothetical protein
LKKRYTVKAPKISTANKIGARTCCASGAARKIAAPPPAADMKRAE